eukprot:scaffold9636_cov76-Skeletonema_dohrnii-CCMP3373.AAC.7
MRSRSSSRKWPHRATHQRSARKICEACYHLNGVHMAVDGHCAPVAVVSVIIHNMRLVEGCRIVLDV